MISKKDNYYALIMAGGVGSRLWPVSRGSYPKQFTDIMGVGQTLIQNTFKRLAGIVPQKNIYVLTNAEYVDIVKEQLPDIEEDHIVPEPDMRNTAPAILLASLKIHKRDKNALTIVAPSDHWIDDKNKFLNIIQTAFVEVEKSDKLITLGIEPESPNTGYGYIQYDKGDSSEFKKVQKFTEKPDLKKAEQFLKDGNYAWNAGIFVWSSKFILESFKEHVPEMYRLFEKGIEILNTAEEVNFLAEYYSQAKNISIDYAILEKAEEVYLIPADFKWNDLGTWSALLKELPKDDSENTVIKTTLLQKESEKNIVYSRKKLVVLKGLEDFIVVDNDDVLIIVPRNSEQEIKDLRQEAMDKWGKELG